MENNKGIIIESIGKLTFDILIGMEVFAFKTCESFNLFQNLSKPSVYELLNDASIQIMNHTYHSIHNRTDERINELCDNIRKHIILHDHCLIILLIRIIKSIHSVFDRTILDVEKLKKEVTDNKTLFNVHIIKVAEHITSIYDKISDKIFTSLKQCNDDCYLEYDSSEQPFKFRLH